MKTEAEKRSFIFDSRKGLEPILFDISDPTLLANVVYRIMQIRFDLDRTFFGTVVNMAGKGDPLPKSSVIIYFIFYKNQSSMGRPFELKINDS